MARKRTDFGPVVDDQIRSLMSRGGTAASISAALTAGGVKGASESTIDRRMREIRGFVSPPRAKPSVAIPSSSPPTIDPPLPTTEDDVPDDADPDLLDRWIRQAKSAVDDAEKNKNFPLMGQMLRVAASLAETRRKATPPAPPDPNEHPDMVALGKQVAERFHKMIDLVAGKR